MEAVSNEFNSHYHRELNRIERSNRASNKKRKFNSWSTVRVIWACYGGEFLVLWFLKLGCDLLMFVPPKLLSQLINFVKHDQPIWQGVLIIFGLILTNLLKNLLINYFYQKNVGLSIRIQSAFSALIFSKSLKLAPKAKKMRTTGEMINLFAVDTGRFGDYLPDACYVWSSLFQIGLAIYLLCKQLSEAFLTGLLIILLVLICNGVITQFLKNNYLKETKIKDERVKICAEVLAGMKIIKLYGWSVFME